MLPSLSRSILSCFIFIVGITSSSLHTNALFADNKNEKIRLAAVKKTIIALEQQRKKTQRQQSKIQNTLQSLEKNIGKTIRRIKTNNSKIAELNTTLKRMNGELDDLEQAKSHQKYNIAKTIRSAYKVGDFNSLQLLLNQDKPDEISRMLRYYDYLNEAHSKKLTDYKETIKTINDLKPTIEQAKKERQTKKDALKKEHKTLIALQHSRKKHLSKINSSLKNQHAKLQTLNKDRKDLEHLIKNIEAAIASLKAPENHSDFKKNKHRMPWPVQGKIRNKFGSWRQSGKLKWSGLFISAKESAKVSPIHHGQVIFADWLRGHGLLIILDHGGGYLSLYAHNQALLKSTGDWVNINDTIATVGNTGGLTESGLYFEVRKNSQPVNPLLWCCH